MCKQIKISNEEKSLVYRSIQMIRGLYVNLHTFLRMILSNGCKKLYLSLISSFGMFTPLHMRTYMDKNRGQMKKGMQWDKKEIENRKRQPTIISKKPYILCIVYVLLDKRTDKPQERLF